MAFSRKGHPSRGFGFRNPGHRPGDFPGRAFGRYAIQKIDRYRALATGWFALQFVIIRLRRAGQNGCSHQQKRKAKADRHRASLARYG